MEICPECGLLIEDYCERRAEVVVAGPFHVGPGEFLIDGKHVNLTRAERVLMREFLRAPGKLVTYTTLIAVLCEVSPRRPDPDDLHRGGLTLLRIRISKLRRKTGADIEAIWGRGYRLMETWA